MGDISSSSLKHKLKTSICACFRHRSSSQYYQHQHQHRPRSRSPDSPSSSTWRWYRYRGGRGTTTTSGSSYVDIDEFPELFKDRCRSLISRISSSTNNNKQRRAHSTDFSYDPSSYSLNFDDGRTHEQYQHKHLPFTNFSSPSSLLVRPPGNLQPVIVPPQRTSSEPAVSISREITAYS